MRRLFAALILLMPLAASAQELPPGKWWRRPEVVRQLSITNEQQTRLDRIFRGAAEELIDSRADIDKLMVEIRSELDQPQLNRANLQRLAAELSEARGRKFSRELMMLVDMRAVLTDPQWETLKDHLERMRGGKPPGPR